MPAKKAKTKKKVLKKTKEMKVTEGVKLYQNLDLVDPTPEAQQIIYDAMKTLQHSGGWILLKRIISSNAELLKEQIVRKLDPAGNTLTDAQVDDLRKELDFYEETIDKPDKILQDIASEAGIEIDYDDPYETVDELYPEDK